MDNNEQNLFIKKSGVFACFFAGLFTIWAFLVATNTDFIQAFDQTVIKVVANNNSTNLAFARNITVVGNTNTITTLTIITLITLLLLKKPWLGIWFTGTMIFANLTNTIIKNFIKRPRPAVHHLVYAGGYSFPSGHSIGSITFFILLIIVIRLLVKNKTVKNILTVLLILFPLMIGYSRIYVHVHFPSDVLGGFILGLSFIFIALWVYKRYQNLILPQVRL